MIIQKQKWFTLVELIIVITILAILATIAFISYNSYTSNARDSVRLSDINSIWKVLQISSTIVWTIPDPDNFIPIKSETTLIWKQWEIWDTNTKILKISWDIKDPLTWEKYPYFINSSNKYWQTIAFLEWNTKWSSKTGKKIIYSWEPLWIILDWNTQEPINNLTSIKSLWEFNTLSWTTATTDIKVMFSDTTISIKPFIIWWQLLQVSKQKSYAEPTKCPDNYIPVPWNKDLWQPWFCAWKYEASVENEWNKSTKLLTKPGVLPVKEIDVIVPSYNLCQWNWPWYHNMTMIERLTLARNIEKVWANRSSWIVWSGYIRTWNSWDNSTGFSSWLLISWSTWSPIHDNLRQLQLSNWQVIWDFIWNVWEIVSPLNFADWTNEYIKNSGASYLGYLNTYRVSWISTWSYVDWNQITDDWFKSLFWPQVITSSGIWLWKVYETSWQINSYFMWWDYDWIWENGLFSLIKYDSYTNPKTWIRCSYYQ